MAIKLYKYQQVRETILAQIASGHFKPNSRIPSERELARQWGMSSLTVSKALSQMEKEGHLVRKHGDGTYVSAPLSGREVPLATMSRGVETRFIVMLINDLSYGFIPHVIHLIEERFTKLGYHIILKNLHHSVEDTLLILRSLRGEDVCGFIFNPIYSVLYEHDNALLYQAMEQFDRPIILINSMLHKIDCNFVTTDNFQGGYEATDYLIRQGHRRIALIWAERESGMQDRLNGYIKAHEDHQLRVDEHLIMHCPYTPQLNSDANPCDAGCTRLFRQAQPPTAIFTVDDYLAHFTLRYCQEHALAVPEDVAIVGFDDFLPSQITTVRQDMEQIARHTVELFIQLLSGKKPAQTRIRVPPKLIVRKTA